MFALRCRLYFITFLSICRECCSSSHLLYRPSFLRFNDAFVIMGRPQKESWNPATEAQKCELCLQWKPDWLVLSGLSALEFPMTSSHRRDVSGSGGWALEAAPHLLRFPSLLLPRAAARPAEPSVLVASSLRATVHRERTKQRVSRELVHRPLPTTILPRVAGLWVWVSCLNLCEYNRAAAYLSPAASCVARPNWESLFHWCIYAGGRRSSAQGRLPVCGGV